MWILVIMLIAGTDGGRAINTDLRFKTEPECRTAAEAITKDAARAFNVTAATCVFTSSVRFQRD